MSTVGVVCVGYQQVCIGQSYADSACDVLVTDGTLQHWVGHELVKTVAPNQGRDPQEARRWDRADEGKIRMR